MQVSGTPRDSEDYYYNRAEKTVIHNIAKLIDFFRKNNLKVVYTGIASLDENFVDVPSTTKKNLVDEENIVISSKGWTIHEQDKASFIEERLIPTAEI